MSEVKMIIELDKTLSHSEKKALLNFMQNELNISEKFVRVFEEKNYIYISEHAVNIYEKVKSEKAWEYVE